VCKVQIFFSCFISTSTEHHKSYRIVRIRVRVSGKGFNSTNVEPTITRKLSSVQSIWILEKALIMSFDFRCKCALNTYESMIPSYQTIYQIPVQSTEVPITKGYTESVHFSYRGNRE